MWSICWFPEIAFSGFELFLEGRRSADIHEFCFQAGKRSDIACVDLQVGLFADCQERHFQSAKRTDKGSTILQDGRFADSQE